MDVAVRVLWRELAFEARGKVMAIPGKSIHFPDGEESGYGREDARWMLEMVVRGWQVPPRRTCRHRHQREGPVAKRWEDLVLDGETFLPTGTRKATGLIRSEVHETDTGRPQKYVGNLLKVSDNSE